MSKRDFTSNDCHDISLAAEKRRKTDVGQSEQQATNTMNEHYTVGWICAITTEYVAAQVFLDEKYGQPEYTSPHDHNDYTLGRIGPHNVVIAVLPDGEYGISSAATTARDMLHSFPNIKIGLMVGIGGGSPSRHDIRLGDVVVSASRNGNSAVLQYDFGKTVQQQRFHTTGYLDQPPVALRTAMNGLRAQYEIEGHELEEAASKVLEKKPRLAKKFRRPDASCDILYRPDVLHPSGNEASCKSMCGLDGGNLVQRPERVDEENTKVHYGLVASANQLMKDALIRDSLAEENDVLCYEMEAAGLMNHFPCLVIRGICDYSDSHKNKEWQGYAAMVAAAYTKDLLNRIPSNKVEAERRIADILTAYMLDVVPDVHTKTIELSEGIKDLLVSKDREKRESILKWLTPIDYALQQSDYNGRRQEGTGQWFLHSTEYKQWVTSLKQTLFCLGIPGAGKTIIASLVIDELYTSRQKDPSIGFAYLYCDFRRQKEQDIVSLLASLLKQLCETQYPLPEGVQNLHAEYKERQKRPCISEIAKVLTKVIGHYSQVFIVIDALDECQVAEGCRARFLAEIFKLQAETGISILCTSRPVPDIVESFQGALTVHIRAQDEDLHHFLAASLHRLPSFVLSNSQLQKDIKDTISMVANDMFLLATLHIDSLAQQPTIGHIKRALKTLPTGLNDTYDQAMARIESQSENIRKMAKKALSWVIHAMRPLSPTELQNAIAIEPGQTDLDPDFIPGIDLACSICAGLITIDTQSNIVRLVHYTTQEYFDETKQCWFTDANHDIASTCITYLLFDTFASGPCQTFQELQERLRSNQLYYYAAQYWGDHAYNALVLPPETVNFLKRTQNVQASGQVLLDHLYYPEELINTRRATGLHLAAHFGIAEALRTLLHDQQPDPKDRHGRTPLWLATYYGHEMIVELLLQHGADVEIQDDQDVTPLLCATQHGHSSIVKQLIEHNANVEKKGTKRHITALSLATEKGHTEVVKVLLELGADPDSKDSDGLTPLAWAATFGKTEVVRVLLELGADPDSKDNSGVTPLAWAAWKGDPSMVELLLQTGVRLDNKDWRGYTPLSYACWSGDEATVKLILKHGFDIEHSDVNGETPMSLAVGEQHEDVMELLLDHGANTEVHNLGSGQTPLIWVAERGHERAVEILLRKGADPEAKDNTGQTALEWAKANGHKDIEGLLLGRRSVTSS
ncbi:hypothetical protein NW762_013638 [Fusarium torreyae]|uniref:Nucleoside phosphorylase domain-containing protein n=1 Tax=Fusarium torreyae TaxID=1237075 RepID=A0A9W8RN09_9HYPO|nr:hypothetical protein NW762_013638 [Fusarium torreyae]